MIKITLDTNILVSGSFWSGASFKILNLIDRKEIILVLSKEILTEYDRVVRSEEIMEKIENKDLIVSKIVQRVIVNSVIVEPKEKIQVIKDDPSDNKFLECAREGQVDYLISNDKKHLLKLKEFEGIKIISPEEFLPLCRKQLR